MRLYTMIQKLEPRPVVEMPGDEALTPEWVEETFAGMGIGQKTYAEICQMAGIDPAKALERLKGKGLSIREDEPLRAAAQRQDLTPLELLTIMLVDATPKK